MFHGYKCTVVAFLHGHFPLPTFLLLLLLSFLARIGCSGPSSSTTNVTVPNPNEDAIRRELVKVQILHRLGLNEKPQVDLAHKISKDLVLETLRRTESFSENFHNFVTKPQNKHQNKSRHGGQSRPSSKDEGAGEPGNYAKTSEIISFPDKGKRNNLL
ncbi:unnamed protein product [Allacma fusca]|uniref:Uncharacterized protein n=1 Tax=Allacma fusca TaxID=39272 RepID=A0A8J2PVI8_9HEXA|nr:unnamed protein product [Allacma fusca]